MRLDAGFQSKKLLGITEKRQIGSLQKYERAVPHFTAFRNRTPDLADCSRLRLALEHTFQSTVPGSSGQKVKPTAVFLSPSQDAASFERRILLFPISTKGRRFADGKMHLMGKRHIGKEP